MKLSTKTIRDYGGICMAEEKKVEAPKTVAKKAPAKKPVAKKTPAKKPAAKKATATKTVAAKKPVAKKAPAKKTVAKKTVKKATPKKLGKIIFEFDGKQIDYKAIEKKAAKLGGNVYVVAAEGKIFDEEGKSVKIF